MKHNQLKEGRIKTGSYVDDERRLDARFTRKAIERSRGNASAPKAQLQSCRVFVSPIAYTKCNFSANDAPLAFLKPNPIDREISVGTPVFSDKIKRRDGNNFDLLTGFRPRVGNGS